MGCSTDLTQIKEKLREEKRKYIFARRHRERREEVVHLWACPRGNHDRAESPQQLSLEYRLGNITKTMVFPAHGSVLYFIQYSMLPSY